MKEEIIKEKLKKAAADGIFVTVNNDAAADFKDGVLSGKTVAVADNISTKNLKTTAGSKILDGYVPTFDATAVEIIKNAGGIILGKSVTGEFAVSKETAFGRNEDGIFDGAAKAVSGGITDFALVSDNCGEAALNAAKANIVCFRPEKGQVSRHGLIAKSSSFDTIAAYAKTVKEAAEIINCISKSDSKDSRCSKASKQYNLTKGYNIKGKKIGVFGKSKVKEILIKHGAEVEEIKFGLNKDVISAINIISAAEFASLCGRYDGITFGYRASGETADEICYNTRTTGFNSDVKKFIMLGNTVLASENYNEYFKRASLVKIKACHEFNSLIQKYDFIINESDADEILNDTFGAYNSLFGAAMLCVPTGGNGVVRIVSAGSGLADFAFLIECEIKGA